MSKSLKARAKDLALKALSRFTNRHAVLLPGEAENGALIFDLRAAYRAEEERLTVDLLEPSPGRLVISLIGYEGHFPRKLLWKSSPVDYHEPCRLQLALNDGAVMVGGLDCGNVPTRELKRRFCLRFDLEGADGKHRSRLTSHYQPMSGRALEAGYFTGDNYVDHEAQSSGENKIVLELLRQHNAAGPVLEVGCATGILLEAVSDAGWPAYGVDISNWAVERANQRLRRTAAWVCDVEQDALPDDVLSHAPFGTLILWAVFEHFHQPFDVLAKLTPLARPGTKLFINTTNADSLTHFLFGRDWEGYFDWSHYGVDQVCVASLNERLPKLGWRIEKLATHLIWDCDYDPTKATLRDWHGADARFRRLLDERNLGDLITCVAVKE